MPWADVNGIRLYYESHGDGPDTIVFAHGAGGNHLSWWQQIPAFSDRYRCVTFDHRAFGQSADVPDGPGMAAFQEDVRALLDTLGIERTFLVAQSMGGSTCMGFTVAWPARVRGLVMADTIGTISDPALTELLRSLREPGFTLAGRAYHPSLRSDLAFLYDSIMALNPPREGLVPGRGHRDERFVATAEKLESLDVPVLFVVGELDAIIPPDAIEAAAKLVPGAKVERVPGCGHSVYFEDASSFNRIVADFVASVV